MNVSWIERTFKKRECIKFLPSKNNSQLGRCSCGKNFLEHPEDVQQLNTKELNLLSVKKDDRWSVQKHTRCEPTDAFGLIEFEGMAHPSKAQVS